MPFSAPFCPFIRDADFAARAPWRVASRRLLDFLLVYVQEGVCEFRVDGTRKTFRGGDWCLVQPNSEVELVGKTATVTPYVHFDVWFNPRRADSFATRPGQLDLTPHLDLLQPRLDELAPLSAALQNADFGDGPAPAHELLQIIESWNFGTRAARLQSENRLGALVLRLAQHQSQHQNARTNAPESARNPLGWVPSYFSARLSDALSVEEMARRARLSPSRFHAVFKEIYGTSPARFLMQMRVEHAAELLRCSDWTLAHIAHLCGFADEFHFAKSFKRATGCTPGQWRKGSCKLAGFK